jgi:N-acetylmuramoyl-L-alanine amidase
MDNNKFDLAYKRKLLYMRKKRRRLFMGLFYIFICLLPMVLIISYIMKDNNKPIATIKQAKNNNIYTDTTFTVCIDPGHGDWDNGAEGINGSKEKDIVLNIGLKLGTLLKDSGIKVIYTRASDSFDWAVTANDSLKERLKVSKVSNADLFISIHCNSDYKNLDSKGIETWYNPDSEEGKNFASIIQNHLSNLHYTSNRGIKYYASKDDALAVLELNTAISTLVELGFLSNKEDEKYLTSEIGQKKCATAIFDGIMEYKEKLEGITPTKQE